MRTRLLLLATVVLALLLGVPALRTWLASDETKIRWRIEDAISDFNRGAVRAADALAPAFADETSGLGYEEIRGAIVYAALQRRTADGRFGYRLETVSDDLQIRLAGEGAATVVLPLRLHDVRREPPVLLWELQVDGELRESDAGWRFTRSRHVTLAGAQPR